MGVRNVLELVAVIFFVMALSFFVVGTLVPSYYTSRRLSAVNSPGRAEFVSA
jgi:hypothetical protein